MATPPSSLLGPAISEANVPASFGLSGNRNTHSISVRAAWFWQNMSSHGLKKKLNHVCSHITRVELRVTCFPFPLPNPFDHFGWSRNRQLLEHPNGTPRGALFSTRRKQHPPRVEVEEARRDSGTGCARAWPPSHPRASHPRAPHAAWALGARGGALLARPPRRSAHLAPPRRQWRAAASYSSGSACSRILSSPASSWRAVGRAWSRSGGGRYCVRGLAVRARVGGPGTAGGSPA